MPLHVIFSMVSPLIAEINIRHNLLMVGLNITNMHITLTLPGDGTHDFLIYYHDTPPPWIHKALKLAIIAQAKRSRSQPSKVSVSSRDRESSVSVSWNCGKVSVSSQTENKMSVSVSCLRSRLHPCRSHMWKLNKILVWIQASSGIG